MKQLIISLILLHSMRLFGTDFNIDTIFIYSNILTEERTILIYTPIELNNNDSITAIYLLDGEFSINQFEKINEMYKTLIIGIGIVNTDRRRDMLPVNQPDKFLEFIEKELIPSIDTKYLINYKILFGHSFAGGFTIYTMISRPGLFDKYIASSPTPIVGFIDNLIYNKLDGDLKRNIKFYFSYGSNDMKQVKKWSLKLDNTLSNLTFKHIIWKNEIYPNENHNTADKISLVQGLKY